MIAGSWQLIPPIIFNPYKLRFGGTSRCKGLLNLRAGCFVKLCIAAMLMETSCTHWDGILKEQDPCLPSADSRVCQWCSSISSRSCQCMLVLLFATDLASIMICLAIYFHLFGMVSVDRLISLLGANHSALAVAGLDVPSSLRARSKAATAQMGTVPSVPSRVGDFHGERTIPT